jgi:hypothetical protein
MDQELKLYLDSKFSEINANFAAVDGKFAAVDARFAEMRTELREEIEKVETNLLRAFHGWSRPMDVSAVSPE